MSKLDDAIALILRGQGGLSNAEIAKRIGCDEGLVRRARKEADIIRTSVDLAEAIRVNGGLNKRIQELENELAAYRRASLPPRKATRPGPYYPLLETLVDDQPVPIVAMIGDPA